MPLNLRRKFFIWIKVVSTKWFWIFPKPIIVTHPEWVPFWLPTVCVRTPMEPSICVVCKRMFEKWLKLLNLIEFWVFLNQKIQFWLPKIREFFSHYLRKWCRSSHRKKKSYITLYFMQQQTHSNWLRWRDTNATQEIRDSISTNNAHFHFTSSRWSFLRFTGIIEYNEFTWTKSRCHNLWTS